MKTRLFLLSILCSYFGYSQDIDLELFAEGFDRPTEIAHAGDDRLFVVEQTGHIKILHPDGSVNETAFLDVSDLISDGNEQGLLGLAFHPDYEDNGYFYINYTNTTDVGNTVIARYSRSASDPDVADPSSALILLTIEQPFSNHNGGGLRFGPDGYLYTGTGDGGSGGDPNGNGQNINVLLGKMLRLDVDADAPYIPAGNPFVGVDGADEIWAIGMRNPWKFSFNRLNDDLWIADVGQEEIEEINKVSPTASGLNYGWRCYEGNNAYNSTGCPDDDALTFPIATYDHDSTGGCSITGGYVYTGDTYPNLQGKYLFADYCSNAIGMVDADNNITFTEPFDGNYFTTFGEDINGELYIAGGISGAVYKITDTSLSTGSIKNIPFAVYPNPAKNEVFITFKDTTGASASIFDIGGKLLLEQSITTDTARIDTSALQSGIYLLTVEASGNTFNQKLVIN
jgi:glucose/arabinose dehydrogenase